MINKELTVGQLAARSGVAVTALHFYENKGLIKSNRNAGNQRRYPRDVLRRVVVIKIAQRLGIPLATIGEALQTLPDERTPTAQDWERLSALWREDLDERINKLMLLRDKLSGCIGCGCLSLEACPLRNRDGKLNPEVKIQSMCVCVRARECTGSDSTCHEDTYAFASRSATVDLCVQEAMPAVSLKKGSCFNATLWLSEPCRSLRTSLR